MKNIQNELHVIFGTGPVGLTLAEQLSAAGKHVRLVNRSGKGQAPAGAELVAGDALQSDTVRDLCQGATAAYHCANVAYEQQVAVIPRLQESIIEGVAPTGAKLIVTDTLYMYGQTHGQVMKEDSPYAATTRKGQMRARVAETYLTAHREGKVRVALGRSADFFGPRVLNSSFGDRVFPAALAGKSIQLLGNIDLPHSYSYMGDVARTLALLGERDEALGRVWHVPVVTPVVTQREMAQQIGKALGKPIHIQAIPKLAVQAFGLFQPLMHEMVEMFYQYTEPQIVDASAIEQAFGLHATPLDEAIRATVQWYQEQQVHA
ncbi:epimerase [Reticulibacter mediterranei]|uniref:Epimerase n=1 Tax=Reticulibacter mediterranei TaxID=2778369 RepID=A0A8J3IR34_9CHLR|nr:NAD-dependent epimerase/dehydratase family protein [Reticulibacter mediterranei]GHO99206.1 epimerase [Reticulibacter mediterranei]